jgi:hypothetical protein
MSKSFAHHERVRDPVEFLILQIQTITKLLALGNKLLAIYLLFSYL